LDHKDKEEFNIDFKNSNENFSEDDMELSFMNFSLSTKNAEQSKEDKIFSDLEKMSIFDLTSKKEERITEESQQETEIEAVPVETVSEYEFPDDDTEEETDEEKTELHRSPDINVEYSEEPLPEIDDVEINIVSWGQKKPLFIDDTKPTKPAEPVVQADENVEIKLCNFRENAERRAQRTREKQKKN
jgi:hypothetical protein